MLKTILGIPSLWSSWALLLPEARKKGTIECRFFFRLLSFPIHTYQDISLVFIFLNDKELFQFAAMLMLEVKAHISAPLTAPILLLVKRQYLPENSWTFNNMLLLNWRLLEPPESGLGLTDSKLIFTLHYIPARWGVSECSDQLGSLQAHGRKQKPHYSISNRDLFHMPICILWLLISGPVPMDWPQNSKVCLSAYSLAYDWTAKQLLACFCASWHGKLAIWKQFGYSVNHSTLSASSCIAQVVCQIIHYNHPWYLSFITSHRIMSGYIVSSHIIFSKGNSCQTELQW